MVAAGTLIWISVRPLIRLVLCVSSGFAVTKADLFPVVAARSVGQIILNITLPSLMFSKMVPAFTPDNVSALGPLVLVALIYEGLGMLMAWITGKLFWVPHRFRYGILVAGGWANVGDIPTSVIMSITGAAPFGGSDQTLSVAYISAFILVYMITLFPMGGHYLVAKDFVGPDVEPDEVREQVRERRKFILRGWPKAFLNHIRLRRIRRSHSFEEDSDPEFQSPTIELKKETPSSSVRPRPHKHVSFRNDHEDHYYDVTHDQDLDATTAVPTDGMATPAMSYFASPAGTVTAHDLESEIRETNTMENTSKEVEKKVLTVRKDRQKRIVSQLKTVMKSTLTPASLSMIVSIPIALVPSLKGLFMATTNSHIPNAPDGQPPLAFVLDFANFMGAASVPIGLICLGSALARLKIPWGEWSSLPVGAIFTLAILKTVVSPVIGVLITIGLTSAGVISKEDKVLQFVCMFFSCLPTATTQVYLTQVYSGTGSAEFMSPFLLPQYFLMFFSMTGLTAYSITYLF
ncbi:MAG: auxin efflux carrier [Lentinula lateritia]|uniref:Auxin efflux carrier n=1 Tax=Lentinula lateritia TaxID=40482 RepID=A0ABQ8VM20_9AGAR|nr:MAG: auxin efflux carrier [Lentinula lateritia]KAJ4497422.1 auxin efflux carrier [Lentinula lateritia]